jgi:Rad3-related DNA helicase
MTDLLPTPDALGLPAAFDTWRPGQSEAILRAIDSPKRHRALVLPTGFGKSLVYMTIPALTSWKTVILTSTKALQRQLMGDFGEDDRVRLVAGQREYACVAVQDGGPLDMHFGMPHADLKVDEGPCHSGVSCPLKDSTCHYFAAVREGAEAEILITNYAWWFAIQQSPFVRIQPDLLVLDEAHAAPDALASAIGARLVIPETRTFLSSYAAGLASRETDPSHWVTWANKAAGELRRRLEHHPTANSPGEARTHRRLRHLATEVEKIARLDPETLIITEEQDGDVMRFDPIWAATFSERHLFRGVPRVVLTSATMTRHTADLLGVLGKDLDLYEAGEGFDVRRRPVYIVPARDVFGQPIRVDHRMSPMAEKAWLQHIDAIVESRPDRKGIIHTVSYRRRDQILAESRFRHRLMSHERQDASQQIARFKAAPPGTVLVSPAVTTGYDFPYDECEYQVLCKIPFPDSRDPITAARTVVDSRYPAHLAMQGLVQSIGRGMRASDDRCETFIVDAHAYWFLGSKHKDLMPGWFRRALRRTDALPAAPPRLESAR